jgi:hypothetical protein
MKLFFASLFGIATGSFAIFFFIKFAGLLVIKGYSRILITLLTLIYFFITIFFISVFGAMVIVMSESAVQSAITLFFMLLIGAGLLFLYRLVAKKIKPRFIKSFGKRKMPFTLYLQIYGLSAVIIVALGTLIFGTIFPGRLYGGPMTWHDYVKILAFIPLFVSFIRAGLKKKALFSRQVSVEDYSLGKEGYTLYLRSFYLDRNLFGYVNPNEAEEFGQLEKFQSFIYQDIYGKTRLSFEEYFGFQISQQMGELVCMGNPNDKAPRDGVTAVYPKPGEWQSLLPSLIQNAGIIIMYIGKSNFIQYELNEVIRSNNLHKLYLFTQPLVKPNTGLSNWKIRFNNWMLNIEDFDPNDTREIIAKCNLSMNFVPEAGSVIAFTPEREAVLLKAGCVLPSEYVSVVKESKF